MFQPIYYLKQSGLYTLTRNLGGPQNRPGHYQRLIYSTTDALVSCLKNNIKIYIRTAPNSATYRHK